MNGLLIAVVLTLAFFVIYGYWRGFIRIAFSLLSMILTIGLVSLVTPYTTDFLKENTVIYNTLQAKCTEQLKTLAAGGDGLGGNVEDRTKQPEDISLAGIQLPKMLQGRFVEHTAQAANAILEETGAYSKAGGYIADWILKGIVFFTAFIVINIVLRFLIGILDLITKLPVIKGMNRLLGMAAGLMQGLLMIWLFLFVVAISCTNAFGQQMLLYISENDFLQFLYDHNGILMFLNYMVS